MPLIFQKALLYDIKTREKLDKIPNCLFLVSKKEAQTYFMNKILITGGAGFIGSNLALKLIEKDMQSRYWTIFLRRFMGKILKTTSPLYKSIKDKVTFIKGEVTDIDDWKKALEDQDAVVHYAAETGTGQSMYEINKYVHVNIQGTALMLDLLVNEPNRVQKVIVASSRSIYGEGKYWSKELGHVYPEHRLGKDMDSKDFEVKYPGQFCLEIGSDG